MIIAALKDFEYYPMIVEALRDLSYYHDIGIINPPEYLKKILVNKDGVAYNEHQIDSWDNLLAFLTEILDGIHEIFVSASGIKIERNDFKFNHKKMLKWQKAQKGYKRPAFAFSNDPAIRAILKSLGFITGNEKDILKFVRKIKRFSKMRLK